MFAAVQPVAETPVLPSIEEPVQDPTEQLPAAPKKRGQPVGMKLETSALPTCVSTRGAAQEVVLQVQTTAQTTTPATVVPVPDAK